MRDMAKRLAMAGYSVLVPNPFYRVAKSPVYENARRSTSAGTGEAWAADGVDHRGRGGREGCSRLHRLDGHAAGDRSQQEDRHPGLLHGWCARRADRCRSVQPRGRRCLVPRRRPRDQNPNSPHLLAPKVKARMYFGIATNDDMTQPDAKTKLKEAFDAAKVPRRGRGLLDGAARLVRARHAGAGQRRRSTKRTMPSARGAS